MSIRVEQHDQNVTIAVDGKLDFSKVQEFRASYQDLKASQVELDLAQTTYLDSAGLGMLLNLKKSLHFDDRAIRLRNCSSSIRKVLQIARFDRKFIID